MDQVWGVILVISTLIAWLGQLIYAIAPEFGAKIGVGESVSSVDSIFYIDARGEAIWDSMIIWTLPVAGILLIFNSPLWVYFGLVGGGSYIYFAGRNLTTRILMQRHAVRIGKPNNIKVAYLFITIWGMVAIITIVLAITDLISAHP